MNHYFSLFDVDVRCYTYIVFLYYDLNFFRLSFLTYYMLREVYSSILIRYTIFGLVMNENHPHLVFSCD